MTEEEKVAQDVDIYGTGYMAGVERVAPKDVLTTEQTVSLLQIPHPLVLHGGEVVEIKEPIRLSPSVAKVLRQKTPLHAWQYHRLLGGGKSKSTESTEDGKIYEAIIFNQPKSLAIVDADSYRTNEAKKARNDAVEAGMIPVLRTDYGEYADAAQLMLKRLTEAGVSFTGGQAQAELIWRSAAVECKGILDYLILGPDYYIIYDLKCVEDASPDKMTRAIVDYGWHIQAAAYVEAVETLHPELAGRGVYKIVACEKSAPNAVNIIELGAMFMYLGKTEWDKAKAQWFPCLRDNVWPGYQLTTVNPLPWQMAKADAVEEGS